MSAWKALNLEDYRQGFLDGMSADQKCPQTLMIMGKTFDEILKLIMKDEEKMATILMTKAEAMKKLEAAGVPRDISGDFHIIKILVALGLLTIREIKELKICNCSAADECPQGRLNSENRCKIWVDID